MSMTAPAETGTIYAPGGLAARRLPLLPRPKPPCRPLAERLGRVARLAGQNETEGDALVRAASACNLAALIASDCAMPGLASDLCWQQFDAYTEAGPHGETVAKLALQPLINLARLRIRDGDADGGYQIIETLYNAARFSHGESVIDDRPVSIPALVSGSTREAIARWLWAVLLSDGLRALCRAARWTDALRHAQAHDGVGQRLLDGRQIAILAHSADGRRAEAEHLIRETKDLEPWERMVALCLQCIVRAADATEPAAASGKTADAYLGFNDPDHAMFSVCLGLTAAELPMRPDDRSAVMNKVTSIALRAQDAYIAREILRSPVTSPAATETMDELRGMVDRSVLGRPLSAGQEQQLTESVRAAAKVLRAETMRAERRIVDSLGEPRC